MFLTYSSNGVLEPHNVRGNRAGGPTRVNVDKPQIVNEGNEFEEPKRQPTPVHRFVSGQTCVVTLAI